MNDIIKKYNFKNGLELEFEIQDLAECMEKNRKIMTVPHRALFFTILWIEKGQGTHYVDFNPVTVKNNSIIFIPQNSITVYDETCEYQGLSILFTDTFFCKNDQDNYFLHSSMLFSDLYPTALIKVNPLLSELKVYLEAMKAEYKKPHDSAKYRILHNILHIFLLQAEREMLKQGFKELKPGINLDYLIQFKALLEQKFSKEKTVRKYASELNLSEKRLHKATISILGETPKQIIDKRIMLEAKRLLIHSSQSIKEIAYDLGFDEPTNFNKFFRKHCKSTPLEFREKL